MVRLILDKEPAESLHLEFPDVFIKKKFFLNDWPITLETEELDVSFIFLVSKARLLYRLSFLQGTTFGPIPQNC